MAPRRGGGGGFGISGGGGSSLPTCPRLLEQYLIVNVIFFVVYAILIGVAARKCLQRKSRSAILLRWWALATSILFGLVQTMLGIIFETLGGCEVVKPSRSQRGLLAAGWLGALSEYLMVAVVMVPIVKHLHESAGCTARLVTMVHTAYLGLLAVILVCSLGIFTFLTHRRYIAQSYSPNFEVLDIHGTRLNVAVDTLKVLGILIAGANTALRLRKSSYWRGTSTVRIISLAVAALGMTLVTLAINIDVYYGHINSDIRSLLFARIVLDHFFYSWTFVAVLMVAGSRQLSDNAGPAVPAVPVTAANPPMGPGMQQPTYSGPVPQTYQTQPQYQWNQQQWFPQSRNV